MSGRWKVMEEWKPSFLMVLVQLGYAATSVLVKLATKDGMSVQVLTAYRLIFGAAFSFSLALIFERCIHILFFSIHVNTYFSLVGDFTSIKD